MSVSHTQHLQSQFGFSAFKPEQLQVIEKLLDGQSSLAIFPTGSGKSLCYQYSALHLPHLTLVVSPLLALMKDQLQFLKSKGIDAASIDSSMSPQAVKEVMARVRQGQTKILMVSVERFKNERFRQFIQSTNVSMLVVDEAHCISEWGHNFRPDYLKLPQYRQQLNIPTVLLLTATATNKVKRDMAARFDISPQDIVQTGFYRRNLDLTVQAVNQQSKDQRLLAVTRHYLVQGSGIVYVMLQHTAETTAAYLQQQGLRAKAYHAGLDSQTRASIQQQFMTGQLDVVVATIAFGMGVDKADIRFVVHYDLPKSIENYSQEIGRGGRDGKTAYCITLANLDGLTTLENFVYGDTPDQQAIESLIKTIRAETIDGVWELQTTSLSKKCNIKQLPLKTLLVQLELLGIVKPLYVYFADFRFKFNTPREQVLSMFSGERRQFLNVIFSNSNFKRVWGSVDIESLARQQGCDRARVVAALDYLDSEGHIELETKKATEVFQVDLSAINPQTSVDLSLYFIEKQTSEINRIGSLIRYFQLDSCLSFNLARYFDDNTVPQQCGHCSVCRGEVAELNYSTEHPWPSDDLLLSDIKEFRQALPESIASLISIDTTCKYLAGMVVPMLSRHNVKKIAGFGRCEQHRYAEIREKVESLWHKIGE